MKAIGILLSLLRISALASAQTVGKAYNDSVDSAAIPPQVVIALRKLAPNAKDISWGHLFCAKCPKDGTYSYYQAEFYQGDDQGKIAFGENAQPVAFSLKAELTKLPEAVQSAIGKRSQRLAQDFQKINVDITSFNVKEKVFYKAVFYIPTEDKKHWTPYDELVFTTNGNITKVTGID